MISFINKLDYFLISKIFTPIVQFSGKHFGWTTVLLTKGCLIGSVFFRVIYTGLDTNAASIIFLAAWLIMIFLAVPTWVKEADKWPNANFTSGKVARLFCLTITIPDPLYYIIFKWPAILTLPSWEIYLAGIYLACCPPAPPKRLKFLTKMLY